MSSARKKSQGTVTPEGKARSAAGAPTRLGLASPDRAGRSVCLKHENRDEFLLLHDTLVTKHAPLTFTEHLTVHEMAVLRWRLRRAWLMETVMDEIDKTYESTGGTTRAALAFREPTGQSPSLQILLSYETRLKRQFNRCLARLANLRAQRKN